MSVDLYHGDCRTELKKLSDNSIDSVVTDPPYGLVSIVKRFGKDGSTEAKEGKDGRFNRLSKGFMGQEWDGTGIEYDISMWSEVLRVMKPGGYLLAFSSTRTYHRMACAIEDSGFEIRDQIAWVYGSGFPKSHDAGDGRGTALKPAFEPICMARKPISEKSVIENIKRWGTGALNIDACRIPGESVPINKLEKWSGFGQLEKPKYEQETNNKGRWPANFTHDGSDEVIDLFPETNTGSFLKHHKRRGGIPPIGTFLIRDRTGEDEFLGDHGSAARFFYCAKASKQEREEGIYSIAENIFSASNGNQNNQDYDKAQSIGMNKPKKRKNIHPTVKPIALMRYLIRLVTPKNGVVLDQFMGSGPTGCAAIMEDCSFVGIEKKKVYFEIAESKISSIQKQMRLVGI